MVGFEQVWALSLFLNKIEHKIMELRVNFNGILLSELLFDNKQEEYAKKRNFFERTKPLIYQANSMIHLFNKMLKTEIKYLRAYPIERLNLEEIRSVIYEHKDISGTGRRHTVLKLNNTLNQTEESIRTFHRSFDKLHYPFGGRDEKFDVRKKVRRDLVEALEIYSIGHFGTAVFLVGKTLERVLMDYLAMLQKKGRVSLRKIPKRFHDRIELLKTKKLITPNLYSKIMSVKWDRNIFAHPSKNKEFKQALADADATIQIATNLIQLLEGKIKVLEAK